MLNTPKVKIIKLNNRLDFKCVGVTILIQFLSLKAHKNQQKTNKSNGKIWSPMKQRNSKFYIIIWSILEKCWIEIKDILLLSRLLIRYIFKWINERFRTLKIIQKCFSVKSLFFYSMLVVVFQCLQQFCFLLIQSVSLNCIKDWS